MTKSKLLLMFFLVIGQWLMIRNQGQAQSPTSFDPISLGKRVFRGPPKLLVAQPQPNSIIFGNQVTTQVIVDNLILVNPERKHRKQKGEGHLHLWLDGIKPTIESAIEHFQVDEYVFDDVPPGKHSLIVEVVNNDHSSFDPPVKEIVHFETITSNPSPVDLLLPSPTSTPITIILSNHPFLPQVIAATVAVILIAWGAFIWYKKSNKPLS